MAGSMPALPLGDVSRRRVLATAAWAAPAIVIASALPAAAASQPPTPSTLALSSVGLTRSSQLILQPLGIAYYFNTTASVAVSGGSASSLTLTVAYPSNVVAANAVSVTSGGAWQLTGSTVSGTQRVFTFAYSQAVAAGSATPTISVRAKVSRTDYRKALSVAIGATGVGNPVASITPVSGSASIARV